MIVSVLGKRDFSLSLIISRFSFKLDGFKVFRSIAANVVGFFVRLQITLFSSSFVLELQLEVSLEDVSVINGGVVVNDLSASDSLVDFSSEIIWLKNETRNI